MSIGTAPYKNWILNNTGERVFSIRGKMQTPYGEVSLTDTDFVLSSITLHEQTSSSDLIEIGSVYANDLKFALRNNNSNYDIMQMRGSHVFIEVGYVLADASTEWIPLGLFIVTESALPTDVLELTCLDHMILFEKPFANITLVFPATVQQIINAIVAYCGVTLTSIAGMTNIGYNVAIRPAENYTCRDMISFCAQLMGKNARMARAGSSSGTVGQLEFVWYGDSRTVTPYTADANIADTVLDGGVVDITNMSIFDGGYQVQPTVDYTLAPKDREQFLIDSGQVIVSGFYYESPEQTILVGSPQYAMRLEYNPLLQLNIDATLLLIWGAIGFLSYLPFTASVIGDPARQAGDLIGMTGLDGITYATIVTSNTYKYRGKQTLKASARVFELSDYVPTVEKRLTATEMAQKALAPLGLIELAKLGNTVIVGGLVATELLTATNIITGRLRSADGFTYFDLDSAEIVVVATVGGVVATINLNPTEGLAFYEGAVKRGGLAVVQGRLVLTSDILKQEGNDDSFISFEPLDFGGDYFSVMRFWAFNNDIGTPYSIEHLNIRGWASTSPAYKTTTAIEAIADPYFDAVLQLRAVQYSFFAGTNDGVADITMSGGANTSSIVQTIVDIAGIESALTQDPQGLKFVNDGVTAFLINATVSELRNPGAANNRIGADNTGAYKIVAGTKTYL